MTRTERFGWSTFIVGVLLLVGSTVVARAQDREPPQPAPPSDWRALNATPQSVDLASIQPLSVVHYSWPIRPQDVLPTPAWWLHDYVRITRGATISADTGTTEAHVRALAKIAAQYGATMAVEMAPYHHASWSDGDPRKTDASYWPWWSARLATMKGWVESEGVSVRMLIFDCERFILKPATDKLAPEWNAAARARYDEAYAAVKAVFGADCYVEWYSRGWYRPIGLDRYQRMAGPYYHFDLTEKGDGVSCVLTRPDWTEPSIASVYETALRSPGANDPLVVWVYMACGYRLTAGSLSFVADHNFDAAATEALARIREDFRPRLRAVIFYSSPGSNLGWMEHFARYAR